jgi:hypothetical protein
MCTPLAEVLCGDVCAGPIEGMKKPSEPYSEDALLIESEADHYSVWFRGIDYKSTDDVTALGVLLFGLRPAGFNFRCIGDPTAPTGALPRYPVYQLDRAFRVSKRLHFCVSVWGRLEAPCKPLPLALHPCYTLTSVKVYTALGRKPTVFTSLTQGLIV